MKAGDLVGGKYRLVRRLGQGAMGVVWEAVHDVTARHVAMKLIVNATDNLRLRLLREARAAGKIAHRNVVEVYDVGETEEQDPFLVMQLLVGETLYAVFKREGSVDAKRGIVIMRDIARARRRARPRHHPPRSQTGQRVSAPRSRQRRRDRQSARLRTLQADG